MSDTVWLKRPKFFEDGSWTLVKIRQVPAGSLRYIDIGFGMSAEDFRKFWEGIG